MRRKNSENQAKWLHRDKELQYANISFNVRFLGAVEVSRPRGEAMVDESIKKLKISQQLKEADAGHKASKLVKVEILISIDSIKIVEVKTKKVICARPIRKISYCADDSKDNHLFAFIAKELKTQSHKCWVVVSENEASEIMLTVGRAFKLAYKRHVGERKTTPSEPAKVLAVKTIEKENLQLKEENERLKQELEANRVRRESTSARDQTLSANNDPFEPNIPMKPTLSSESFDFVSDTPQPLVDMFTEHDTGRMDMFGTWNSPNDEDFIVKQDPFADTPEWSNTASMSSGVLARQLSAPEAFINGSLHGGGVVGLCENSFANTVGRKEVDNPDVNSNESFSDQSSDLFTRYLSNVDAQGTPGVPVNNVDSNSNESFFIESKNSVNNSDQFNIDDPFSTNNELGFHRINLTDTSGNTIDEFNDTENSFFGENYLQRPNVLTADKKTFQSFSTPTSPSRSISKSLLTSSHQNLSCQVPAPQEGGLSPDDTSERRRTKSVGVSYNHVARPRPTGLAVKSQVLPAPPSKQSVKNAPAPAILIETPTEKILPSSPLKEDQPSSPLKEDQPSSPLKEDQSLKRIDENKTRTRSASSILPYVRNATPVVETRARSRTRLAPLQPALPLNESISRASKSLEDLCSLDAPTSTKSLSPKSTPDRRVSANPFIAVTPQL